VLLVVLLLLGPLTLPMLVLVSQNR